MSDQYEALREAVEATPELRGEWSCWNGWGPLRSDRDLMGMRRIGPRAGGGVQGYTSNGDGDVYAQREHAELVALACEHVAALLAERDFLLASLREAEHAQCGCVSLSHVLAAVGATGDEQGNG